MRKWLLTLFLFTVISSQAQLSEGYKELKAFAQQKEIQPSDSSIYLPMYNSKGIHYLLPFYKAFFREKELLKHDSVSYYQELAQAISFLGDNASVLELAKIANEKQYPTNEVEAAKTADSVKGTVYEDARTYILSKAKKNRVVMINEAHDKPLHRAFTISLLEDLYRAGFRYLAMEMLRNYGNNSVTDVSSATGYYVAEPVAGELVRKALEIGYTLLPYEDFTNNHTVKQREYAQAKNIADFLKRKDSSAKILVHAGYGHIQEGSSSDEFIPMAAYFKIISGIDPLTIDQIHMTEGSNTSFEASIYNHWIKKHPVTNSSVILLDNKSIDIAGQIMNDIYVIHPPTKYINGRPGWMSMNGWKQETPVAPAHRSLFLVQAYYASEYKDITTVDKSIPADQTYQTSPNGMYYLYLRKGKYKLVFRDKSYEVLGTKDIEVN
jgi:hypothetical protein